MTNIPSTPIFERKDCYGNYHHDTQPALIQEDGTVEFHKHGALHRDNGPAAIGPTGTVYWFKDGELHNSRGPAIIYAHGGSEYWIRGHRIDKPTFDKIANLRRELEKLENSPMGSPEATKDLPTAEDVPFSVQLPTFEEINVAIELAWHDFSRDISKYYIPCSLHDEVFYGTVLDELSKKYDRNLAAIGLNCFIKENGPSLIKVLKK